MSLDAMDWVWEYSVSKGIGRLVMIAIADKVVDNKYDCKAYAAYAFLQKRANCGRDGLNKAIPHLLESAELEIVVDEKGPYGATVWRLPKAVGYVRIGGRQTHSDRTAQRTDSKGSPASKSDRSADRRAGANRSAQSSNRSAQSAESDRSADYRTNTSETTSSRNASADAHATDGGGGGQQDQNYAAALALVADLDYFGKPANQVQQKTLVKRVHAALVAGWTESALRRYLDLGTGTDIVNAGAVYLTRLQYDRLPSPPASAGGQRRSGLPPWCGKCNDGIEPASPNLRFTEDEQGRAVKCSCHPNYQPSH